jgi:dipeptidyl aminopeptidase/acylaminoacyl peptidase
MTAHFWDVETCKERRLVPLLSWDARLAIDPAGTTLALPDADDAIRLYDLATGKERGRLAGHKGLLRLALSADGRRLASAGPERIVLWEVATGKQLRAFNSKEGPGHGWFAYSMALSPDGALLAAQYGAKVGVWETATGHEVVQLREEELTDEQKQQKHWLWGCLCFSPDGRTLATGATGEGHLRLWEVATGQERRRLEGHQGSVDAIAFSRDGRILVTGGGETAALVWDLRPAAPTPLTADALKGAWADLASTDAAKAYQAVQHLATAPGQGVPFLREALPPVPPADEKRIARLIADLDGDAFATREHATAELEKLGEAALLALRRALAGKPSAEQRRRCEELLRQHDDATPGGERLRVLRAVEALEQAGTREARDVLRRLAGGAEGAQLTREARAALARLPRMPRDVPSR